MFRLELSMDINELWPGKSVNGLTLINWAQNYGTLISSCVHPYISICRVESRRERVESEEREDTDAAALLGWILSSLILNMNAKLLHIGVIFQSYSI